MTGVKTIRSLERGLQVLRAMQEQPISSLHEINQRTRIPKPTLLRILRTLEVSGAVSRRLADGRYRISATLTRLARKPDRYDRVAEAAAPVLDRLCRKISWPSDLMVPPATIWKSGRQVGSAPHSRQPSCTIALGRR